MTTAAFKYIDPDSLRDQAVGKPWTKVDDGGKSFSEIYIQQPVHDVRGQESRYTVDTSGFQFLKAPAQEKTFTDDTVIREHYYQEVEQLVRDRLARVKKVVIFDHTIRRRQRSAPRQPVQQVHVDQTPKAAEARVFRHLPRAEAESLVKGRYQIMNVWRPIQNVASDFPLAVIDWTSTCPEDLVEVDLLYPLRLSTDDADDRGKEMLPIGNDTASTSRYEARGETFAVKPNERHRFYYLKNMEPSEALFIKCFDSRSAVLPNGISSIAAYSPHTAFVDPQTPEHAPGRQSIEVRCLVFYD